MLDVEQGHFPQKSEGPLDPDVPEAIDTNSGFKSASTSGSDSLSDDLPQHRLRAWLTTFGAFVGLFVTFGQMVAIGSFLSWYAEHQLRNMPPSTISWIASMQLFVFFISGSPIGRAFDAYGPSVLLIAGTLITVFSIMMTSLSTQFYQYILCQGILFGLGTGLMFYTCLAAVSSHFVEYRATAIGIASAGSSIGGVLYPIMMRDLLPKLGFGWTVRISGLTAAVGCMVATLTVTSRVPATERQRPVDMKGMFNDPRFTLLAAGSFFLSFGIYIPYFYISDYALSFSISPNTSFYILAALNAGGLFGRVVPAWLSDKLGRFNLLTPSAFLSGLSCLVFWLFAKSFVTIMLFAITYGFFSGAFISVITPCVAQISDLKEIGSRIGMLYSIISVPSLLGGPISGAFLTQAHGNYTGLIIFSGTTVIVGSVFILLAKLKIDSRILARV